MVLLQGWHLPKVSIKFPFAFRSVYLYIGLSHCDSVEPTAVLPVGAHTHSQWALLARRVTHYLPFAWCKRHDVWNCKSYSWAGCYPVSNYHGSTDLPMHLPETLRSPHSLFLRAPPLWTAGSWRQESDQDGAWIKTSSIRLFITVVAFSTSSYYLKIDYK